MEEFPRLRMQKSSWMLLTRNIHSFQIKKKMSYLIITGWMFVLNPMSLMCHLMLGG